MAADVTNQPGLLKAPGRLGDALAASSQHVGDELLGEQQFLRPHPVVGEQQPAAESLLDRVKAVPIKNSIRPWVRWELTC